MKSCIKKIPVVISIALSLYGQPPLTPEQKKTIGTQIWHNECSKRYDRLVFWKENENFPSLGICHFIWYPKKSSDIYTQTFPELLNYFKKKKVKLPDWLAKAHAAPWKSKTEFDMVAQGAQVQELRKLLYETMDLQVEFLIERLEQALPRLLKKTASQDRKQLRKNFEALTQTPQGTYALLDYLNFKGDGTNAQEQYNGAGWGLLQVLQAMKNQEPTVQNFVSSAQSLLTARVTNAPAHKAHERDWLQGWFNRLNTYLSF